jgi:hypothetical protein
MARLRRDIRLTFSGGEISPLALSRADLEKYYTSVETLENFITTPWGPAERRSGTRFVAEVKTSSKKTRIINFQFSTSQAYILEFGDLYMRVYRNGGQVQSGTSAFELVTPYTEAQLPDLQSAQSADTLFVVHQDVAPRKITRTGDAAWTVKTINFLPPPSVETNVIPATTLTLSAVSGNGQTATAGAAAFLASDVGREIQEKTSGTGRAVIVAFTSTTVVTVDIIDAFSGTSIASGNWTIEHSPNTTLTPSAKGPRFAITTLTLGAAGWRSGDVGKFVKASNGVVKITKFTSSTVVDGQILKSLTGTGAVSGGDWTLEEEAWTASKGFPRSITLYEGRAVYGGTATYPQTIWGSVTEDLENFGEGTNDDDAYSFVIASPLIDVVQWIEPVKRLFVGTFGAEHIANNGVNDPITPSNIQFRDESSEGSPHRKPIRIKDTLIFINRNQSKLIELGFSLERDSFLATNLLLLAEHLAGPCTGTLVALAFQKETRPIIWLARSDGVLMGITYVREQNVIAAHRHPLGGVFGSGGAVIEDIAVIPHWTEAYDTVWLVVKRTINGATKRYIEHIDRELNTDSALTLKSVSGTVTSVSGLDHLEGQTVWVVGDHAPQAQRVVSSGSVTVSPAAEVVEAGLGYNSKLVTPALQYPGAGTLTGLVKKIVKAVVSFRDTVDARINSVDVTLGTGLSPFTDDTELENLGYDRTAKITVEQVKPVPMTILEIAAEASSDDDRK